MNILVTGVQVPFTKGGAEFLIEQLLAALRRAGHSAELVQIPFSALPKQRIIDSMLLWRSLNLESFAGREIDLVIGTKFPSYCVPHRRKVIWLIHQHRQAYDLYGTRFGDFSASTEDEALRQMIVQADEVSFREAKAVFTISGTVSKRLQDHLGVQSEALLPPPPFVGKYHSGSKGDYILCVGRLCSIKRPDLLIQSLPMIDESLRVKLVGVADEPGYETYLQEEIRKSRVGGRVDILGRVEENELLSLYANSFAVYYGPHDEDYGFVTLEAFSSGKPLVTTSDSGGVLSFVKDGKNGLVVVPEANAIAQAFNRLKEDELYNGIISGIAAAPLYSSWEGIVEKLTKQ